MQMMIPIRNEKRRGLIGAAALTLWFAGWCPAQTPAPDVAPSAVAQSITALPVPEDQAAIEKRASEIQARLDEIGPIETVTEETPAAQKALIEAKTALKETFELYLQALDGLSTLRARSAELAADETIQKRTKLVADYRRRIAEIDARMQTPARRASEMQADLDETQDEYEQLTAAVESEGKLEASRQEQLAGFAQREKDAEAALTAVRGQLDAYLKSPPVIEGVDPETAEKIAALRLRNLVRKVELELIRRERLALAKSVAALESTASQSVLPTMREYQAKLGDFRRELHKNLTRSLVDRIETNLAASKTDVERAYWQYRKVIAQARQFFGARIDEIRQRFREGDRADINRDVARLTIRYERIIDGLSRTSGTESKAAYEELAGLIAEYKQKQASLVSRLDASLREQDTLLLEQDRTYEALEARDAEFKKAIEALGDDNPELRQKYEAYLAEITVEHVKSMEDVMKRVLDLESDLIARLNQSIKMIDEFLEKLQVHRDRLFWSYTLARGENIISHIRSGVSEARSQRPAQRVGAVLESASERVRQFSRTQWAWFAGALVVSAIVGWLVRLRLISTADRREQLAQEVLKSQDQEIVGFTTRLRIQGLGVWARWVPVAFPLGVVLVGLLLWDDSGPQRAALIRLVAFLLGATLAYALVFGLFEVAKPRFRIIPCSNVVAQHYRRWGAAILLTSLVFVPVITVLEAMDIAPESADALRSVFRVLVMVMVLLFARNRRTVVRIVGRRFTQRHPRWMATIIGVYPLVAVVIAILLALQLAGYDALVGYVVRNVGQTGLAILVAIFLSNLIDDWAPSLKPASTSDESKEDEAPAASVKESQLFDLMIEDFEAKEMSWLAHWVASICRWMIALGTVVWICAAWGMTQVTAKRILSYPITHLEDGKPAVTVWRVLAAIAAIVVIVRVSRMIRATLHAKVYPAYAGLDRGAQATINAIIHYSMLMVGIYIALRLLHLNLGALAVLLGGLGLGLGLGLQPLIVNFVSGIIMLAERHVKVGDIVEVDGSAGEVTSVSMRSTQIKTFDNIDMVIPNSEFVTGRVTNWTLQDTRIRGKLNVGVAYGTNIQRVREILLEIARSESRVLRDPEPVVWFVNFGESSLDFVLVCWFVVPGDRWSALIDMRYEIDRRFREEKIEIPFPQRTLSIHPDTQIPVITKQSTESSEVTDPDSSLPPASQTADPPPSEIRR